MNGLLLVCNLKLNCLIFFTGQYISLIIFIWTYTVNYRNALDSATEVFSSATEVFLAHTGALQVRLLLL